MIESEKPKPVKATTEMEYTRIVSPTQIIHVIKTIIVEPIYKEKK